MSFILNNNYLLSFRDKYSLQTKGTAMGTKMALWYAKVFMNKVESDIIDSFEPKPNTTKNMASWWISFDDFKLQLQINSLHDYIRFTFEAYNRHPLPTCYG